MEPKHWPALPDRDNVHSVFQAYGNNSHIAVVRSWTENKEHMTILVSCLTCGFRHIEQFDHGTPAGRDRLFPALDAATAMADQHVEGTRG
jgi:hypothetical protein